MNIEKLLSGGFLISQLDKQGCLFKMRYMDYTKREAIALFKADFRAHQGTI